MKGDEPGLVALAAADSQCGVTAIVGEGQVSHFQAQGFAESAGQPATGSTSAPLTGHLGPASSRHPPGRVAGITAIAVQPFRLSFVAHVGFS